MLQLQILSPKRFAREFLVGFAQIGGQFIVLWALRQKSSGMTN